jgi:hypothetical protein
MMMIFLPIRSMFFTPSHSCIWTYVVCRYWGGRCLSKSLYFLLTASELSLRRQKCENRTRLVQNPCVQEDSHVWDRDLSHERDMFFWQKMLIYHTLIVVGLDQDKPKKHDLIDTVLSVDIFSSQFDCPKLNFNHNLLPQYLVHCYNHNNKQRICSKFWTQQHTFGVILDMLVKYSNVTSDGQIPQVFSRKASFGSPVSSWYSRVFYHPAHYPKKHLIAHLAAWFLAV